jgi:hypothetical protein
MLHNVLIMTGSGLAVFEKIWVHDPKRQVSEKGRLFGSLITTMQEFSRQSTGMVVTYVEFGQIAVSIVDDARTKLICTLFHDLTDGADFGKIIATSILRSFLETFPDVNFSGAPNVATFNAFGNRIFDAINNSVKSILQQLQTSKGVSSAIVLSDNYSESVVATSEEDPLGMVANLAPILSSSQSLFSHLKQQPKVISLEMSRQVVFVHKIEDHFLVTICKKNVNPPIYIPAIEKSILLLEKVFTLAKDLAR